jgi:AcrR family transcriptional regulator
MGKRPGRKRNEASREAILSATFTLMEEDGFDRLSIEGVAARAGVAKTTIYRWWSTKGTLAVEAFLTAAEPLIAFRDSGTAHNDIVRELRSLAALYRGFTGRFVRELIGACQYDPAMRDAFLLGFLEPRREQARAVVRRGVATGEFRTDLDYDVVVDTLYAPIYFRLLASSTQIDDAFITSYVELILRSLNP